MQQGRLSAAKTKVKIKIKKGENQIGAEDSKHTLPAPSCSWPSPPHPPPPPPHLWSFPSLAHQGILSSGLDPSFLSKVYCCVFPLKAAAPFQARELLPANEAAGTTTSTSFCTYLSLLILVSPSRLEVPCGAAPSSGIPCISHLRMPCTSWLIPGEGPSKAFPPEEIPA